MVLVLRVYDRQVSSRILRPESDRGWRGVIIRCCRISIINFKIFGIQSKVVIEFKVKTNKMDWACNVSLGLEHKT